MSFVRRVEAVFTGNASNFDAAINRVTGGLTRAARGFQQSGRQSGIFNNQLKAIGTTARYALAGQLVFGISASIQRLSDFKKELGTIDSLAAQMNKRTGNLTGLGSSLQDVGQDAVRLSLKLGVAVTDIEGYMERFFSSFEVGGSQAHRLDVMNQFVGAVTNLNAALGSEAGDPSALAGGIAGLIQAIPGARRHIGSSANMLSNYFAYLTQRTPNITGTDIANASGRLASSMSLAAIKPDQLLAAFGVAAQSGGSPAIITRGIAQLFGSSLLNPKSKKNILAYTQAGVPTNPNILAGMGGLAVLEKLMQAVAPHGISFSRNQLRQFQQGGVGGAIAGAASGPLAGVNLQLAYNLFGRQESLRQFINIISQGGIPALDKFVKGLREANKHQLAQQRARLALNQQLLQRFSVARQDIGLTLMQGLDWPLENLVARPAIFGANVLNDHPKAVKAAFAALFGVGAIRAVGKAGWFGAKFGETKWGSALAKLSGARRFAVQQAISKEELPAAISGGPADGSRANPFWVIISPLSEQINGPPSSSGGGGGGNKPPPVVTGAKSILERLASAGPIAAAAGLLGGPAIVLSQFLGEQGGSGSLAGAKALGRRGPNGFPLYKLSNGQVVLGGPRGATGVPFGSNHHTVDAARVNAQPSSLAQFTKVMGDSFALATRQNKVQVEGTATVTVESIVKNTDGTVLARGLHRGVPVRLQNPSTMPSTKGKPGSRRGANH